MRFGGWALALAKILTNGKVYAIDLLDESLSVLRGRIRQQNIMNLEVVRADVEKTIIRLLSNSVDIVLMTNLLFQLKDRQAAANEAVRVLKPGGRLLVVDWNDDAKTIQVERINAHEVKTLAADAGLRFKEEFAAGIYHYGLIFEKP